MSAKVIKDFKLSQRKLKKGEGEKDCSDLINYVSSNYDVVYVQNMKYWATCYAIRAKAWQIIKVLSSFKT